MNTIDTTATNYYILDPSTPRTIGYFDWQQPLTTTPYQPEWVIPYPNPNIDPPNWPQGSPFFYKSPDNSDRIKELGSIHEILMRQPKKKQGEAGCDRKGTYDYGGRIYANA